MDKHWLYGNVLLRLGLWGKRYSRLLRQTVNMTLPEHPFYNEELKPFDITECASAVRKYGKVSSTLEEFAQSATTHLFSRLLTQPSLLKSCALVRFFRTVEFQSLEPKLMSQALIDYPNVKPTDKFLTLLGTTGVEPEWNTRTGSEGHQLIPLHSAQMISSLPMISRLLTQLGIEISSLLSKSSNQLTFTDPIDRDYNIFFVPDARNSPFIPAQKNFVEPFAIRSVVGFGSLMPTGDFYAVIMFFRIILPPTILKQFTTLALSTTIAVLSVPIERIFKTNVRKQGS